MKIRPSQLETDGEGNEFVSNPGGTGVRQVFTDQSGNRYVKRSLTSRILSAVVGVVMLGYAAVTITRVLEFPLHLQYVGAAGWTGSVPSMTVALGLLAGAIGFGVLHVSYTGREGVYVTDSGAIIDDVPGNEERSEGSWEFGSAE